MPWRLRGKALVSASGALMMPVIIFGGIRGGAFTPTEAAVVAVFYGLFVGMCIHRTIKVREFVTGRFQNVLDRIRLTVHPRGRHVRVRDQIKFPQSMMMHQSFGFHHTASCKFNSAL